MIPRLLTLALLLIISPLASAQRTQPQRQPIAVHMGLGPPGAAYIGYPKYRMSLSNPLLLEDLLVRHPKLRLYVMHAGWPMLGCD
jgi:Amidohydrolase